MCGHFLGGTSKKVRGLKPMKAIILSQPNPTQMNAFLPTAKKKKNHPIAPFRTHQLVTRYFIFENQTKILEEKKHKNPKDKTIPSRPTNLALPILTSLPLAKRHPSTGEPNNVSSPDVVKFPSSVANAAPLLGRHRIEIPNEPTHPQLGYIHSVGSKVTGYRVK